MKRICAVIVIVSYLAGVAMAEDNACKLGEEKKPATFVETVAHGVGLGAFTGLAAGWVRYADQHEMQNMWESMGYGTLGGLGVGVGAAIIGKEGTGNLVLTDMDTASGLGGGLGFTWGIIAALFTGESPRIADGLAWGHLAGLVLGIGWAGYKIAAGKYSAPPEDNKEEKGTLQVNFFSDPALACAGIGVHKRF